MLNSLFRDGKYLFKKINLFKTRDIVGFWSGIILHSNYLSPSSKLAQYISCVCMSVCVCGRTCKRPGSPPRTSISACTLQGLRCEMSTPVSSAQKRTKTEPG